MCLDKDVITRLRTDHPRYEHADNTSGQITLQLECEGSASNARLVQACEDKHIQRTDVTPQRHFRKLLGRLLISLLKTRRLARWSLQGEISIQQWIYKVEDALSGLGSRVFPVYHTNKLEN